MTALLAMILMSPALEHRWFYVQTNLLVEDQVFHVQNLLRRASKAGYNGMVLTDTKMQSLMDPPAAYRKNIETVLAEAKKQRIEVIPVVLPVGYAGSMLASNPSLIEAMPVKDAPFLVKDGTAQIQPDPDALYRNGGFEDASAHRFAGFAFQDGIGKATFADTDVVHSGKASLRIEAPGQLAEISGNCRVMQTVPVKPWRHYAFTGWLKTEALERPQNVRMLALSPKGKPLSFMDIPVQPTMEWTPVRVTFNSQDHKEALLYLGIWDGKGGKLWWDDVRLEELGLMNLVRRPGCPFLVKGEDGIRFEEGKDYENATDPKAGKVPWSGEYDPYHESPPLRILPDGKIKEGQRLRLDYYHAVTTEVGKSALCLSEPGAKEIERLEIERVRGMFQPRKMFLAHDEIRVMNWCSACRARSATPAEILRKDVLEAIARMPKEEVFVWSDMFDPNHNAVDGYYLVNGTLKGSWEGLPKRLTIVNWNQNNAETLRFFGSRGHRQILAGYYDGTVDSIKDWLAKASGVKGVNGVMYTTWQNRYEDLEAFAKAAFGGG
ncbi:MAG TPA: hypothetical protein VGE01_09305 [Fimbriimonas sp.]